MKPTHYDLYLAPDLETFMCPGHVTIDIENDAPIDTVHLNAVDIDITACVMKQGELNTDCAVTPNAFQQEIIITLPATQTGNFSLSLTFSAQINNLLVGLYRSKYIQDGEEKYLAVTQFEEREARRVFPCFDQPSQKATFDITFQIDAKLKAIANTAIANETPQPDGKKLVRFVRTPKMSTYLLFFGIGDFEIIDDGQDHPAVRVITTPGKTKYGDFALDWGRKSLDFGEDYTGIPYPISKCDYIAVPDFAFGAMENYGAITFRENALLVYPDIVSQRQKVQIASVIAHETAHMWFGDLVSPAQWRDIWLNESFATYFTYIIPDHYEPAWKVWEDFYGSSVLRAMARDALDSTVPIELPEGEDVHIDASSAPIIYNKGAAIIRMLARYLGEEKLKQGLNYFLDQYRFDSANSAQYWAAFEQATGEPVRDFANSWVTQPGYPLVTVQREQDTLKLSQTRFMLTGSQTTQSWIIPIDVMMYMEDGSVQTRKVILDAADGSLTLPEGTAAYKLNAGQTGFYRVKYSGANLTALGERIARRAGDTRLSAADSCGIESDLFALMLRGDYSLSTYLDFVKYAFSEEERYLPLNNLSQNLMRLYLIAPSHRERISAIGRDIFEKALLAIQLMPQPKDGLHTAHLRDTLLWSAFSCGSEEAAAFGETQFQAVLEGQNVPADILGSIYKIGAVTKGEAAMKYFCETLADADAPEVKKLTVLNAMGCFRDPQKLRTVLDLNFSQVPQKNRAYVFGPIAQNPTASDFLWEWIRTHINTLKTMHPSHFGRVLVTSLPICGQNARDDAEALLDDIAVEQPMQQPVLAMVRELMEIYGRLS